MKIQLSRGCQQRILWLHSILMFRLAGGCSCCGVSSYVSCSVWNCSPKVLLEPYVKHIGRWRDVSCHLTNSICVVGPLVRWSFWRRPRSPAFKKRRRQRCVPPAHNKKSPTLHLVRRSSYTVPFFSSAVDQACCQTYELHAHFDRYYARFENVLNNRINLTVSIKSWLHNVLQALHL